MFSALKKVRFRQTVSENGITARIGTIGRIKQRYRTLSNPQLPTTYWLVVPDGHNWEGGDMIVREMCLEVIEEDEEIPVLQTPLTFYRDIFTLMDEIPELPRYGRPLRGS